MGPGRCILVLLAAALASACGSGDDKPTQLNPQPEYPTRLVDPRSASTKGGATSTSKALRGSEGLSARDAVRIPSPPTPQSGVGGEGGAEGDGQ